MSKTILLKRSSSAGAIPTAGSLTEGELALNTTDAKLYTKKNDGTVVELGGGVTKFVELDDTPASFSGYSGQKLAVKDDESGLEFINETEVGTVEARYRFSTPVTAVDPGSGRIRINNTDYSLATEVYVSENDNNGINIDGAFQALSDGDILVLRDTNGPKFVSYDVISKTDNGTWWTIAVTYRKHSGAFNNLERLDLGFVYLGVKTL